MTPLLTISIYRYICTLCIPVEKQDTQGTDCSGVDPEIETVDAVAIHQGEVGLLYAHTDRKLEKNLYSDIAI